MCQAHTGKKMVTYSSSARKHDHKSSSIKALAWKGKHLLNYTITCEVSNRRYTVFMVLITLNMTVIGIYLSGILGSEDMFRK